MGIVVFDARDDPLGGARGPQVFVNVRNFGAQPAIGRLELTLDGSPIAARALSLAADGSYAGTFSAPGFARGGVVAASLTGFAGDALSDDNAAALVLPPSRPRRVLLVTRGNLFLERAVSLDPSVDLYEVAPEQYAGAISQNAYDVTIFDDDLPSDIPPGRYLVFHSVNSRMPVTNAGGDLKSPIILDWERTHPVMRFVNLTNVHVQTALSSQIADSGEVLADGSGGPLIAASDQDGRQVVWTAFALSASDFPLKVAFPVFITNALGWLASGERDHPFSVASGTPFPLPPSVNGWAVQRPDGKTDLAACSADACSYSGTNQIGIYTARNGRETLRCAVNLTSIAESDIVPVAHPSLVDSPSASRTQWDRLLARRDLWTWVAFAALALLALEWLAYHRRI